MTHGFRPLAVALLGLLLLLWGPCPGLWANTIRAADPHCECDCGCEHEVPADAPLDEDCPFCSLHGGRAEIVLAESVPTVRVDPAPAPGVEVAEVPTASDSSIVLAVEILRPPRDGPRHGIVQNV